MWREAMMAAWLLPMSVMDVKSRRVPAWMLWIGAVAAVGTLLYEMISKGMTGWQVCRGLLPGLVMLAVAFATGKAGMADGIIILLLGIFAGYEVCVAASLGGLFLLAFFSGILLVLRKVKRDTRIPFVPFLTVGWLLAVCGKGMG